MEHREVWKFPVSTGSLSVDVPLGAQALTIQVQHGRPFLWVLVDPKARLVPHGFLVVGTGDQIPDTVNLKYVGTFQVSQGYLVFHLFDMGER